jgi:hypothetical protein
MLNRVLRYAPPWISYSKKVCISGLNETKAESLFKNQLGSFKVSYQFEQDSCFLTLRSNRLWLADFDNRQAFLSDLSDVMSRILNIAIEHGAKLNTGYYRASSESTVSLDRLAFHDEYRLHFFTQQEQKRFMNEVRWFLPLFTSRFGRTVVDDGNLGSQNSYRYSKGLIRQAIGWASTEPIHLARVNALLDNEFGEGGMTELELYPSYDNAGMPEVILKCIDAPFFLRSVSDALLLILAIGCRNSRRTKNQIPSDRVNSFELQNRFRKATSDGLSGRTVSSTKSFRVQILELVSSMRKEFLAIDASKDELQSLCAALAMRAMSPGKRIPNTDTEFIRFISKQRGQSLIEVIESLISSREFLNHKSVMTLGAIDAHSYSSVCADISNWIESEDFELFREVEAKAQDVSDPISENLDKDLKDKEDASVPQHNKSRNNSGPQSAKSDGSGTIANHSCAIKQFSEFIDQLKFVGEIIDSAGLATLLLKYKAMEPVFGAELFKLARDQREETRIFDKAIKGLGLQEYKTSVNTENQKCPYLSGALEQLESKGMSLIVLTFGEANPRELSISLRKFCQEQLSGVLCFPIKRYKIKDNMHQRLLLLKTEGAQS